MTGPRKSHAVSTPLEWEEPALQPDTGIVEVRDDGHTVELAMSGAALTGFLAWLEASPPGSSLK